MTYYATIFINGGSLTKPFPTLFEAEEWLDSQNNNNECRTMIEGYDETGRKTDGFFYTEGK